MFTSRLPKSTSARRPSNPYEGSTSLFGSNIPVSVRKANLFTPQPKRSLQTGLSSTSRKSYMTTDKKYQRPSKPVPDRDEQIKMFDSFTEFLRTHAPGFAIPEAKKFFSSVSTTEASRIFEFLISQFLPEFKISKLETDVPEALALLGYPYIRSVTKSALVSITTRQAIGNLLVIFDWLVQRIQEVTNEMDGDELGPVLRSVLNDPDGKELQRSPPSTRADLELRARIYEEYEQLVTMAEEVQVIKEDIEKHNAYYNDLQRYCEFQKTEYENINKKKIELENEIAARAHALPLVDVVAQEEPDIGPLEQKLRMIELKMETVEKTCEAELQRCNAEKKRTKEVGELFKKKALIEESKWLDKVDKQLNVYRNEKEEYTKMSALNLENLKRALETNRAEVSRIVREAEVERDVWKQLAPICKNNLKIAKRVYKKHMKQ